MIVYSDLGRRGRLGNALFELAATIGVASRRMEMCRFPADWLHRPYFNVPAVLFGDCAGGTEAWMLKELDHLDHRAKPYMQDVHLFSDCMDMIRTYLRPSAAAEAVLNQEADFHALERPILSVHVRRGDNVPGQDPGVPDKERYFVCPGAEYYQAGIDHLRDRAATVAVFSDDIDWCRRHLEADYFHVGTPHPKEHEAGYWNSPLDWIDLQLMAQCDLHVTSGSTYGIWGALLANGRSVVRPVEVYGPALRYIDSELLFPSHWTPYHVNGQPACS